MSAFIGIREEDKNPWERRAPLTPGAVAALTARGIRVAVERSQRRTFADSDYDAAGARMVDDVGSCDLVIGIKEMPPSAFRPGGAYLFFSHTIKGQAHNRPMLRALAQRGCTLLDYELVKDAQGRRLIFFGRYAGLAGMIDTLWTVGRRLLRLGIETPFAEIRHAMSYSSLRAAQDAVAHLGRRIASEGLPGQLVPMAFGFTGYGNVSRGAQEIFDLLPHRNVAPSALPAAFSQNPPAAHELLKVVYREEDLVEPTEAGRRFDLQDYYEHPERYRSTFGEHLSLLSVIVNGIFWTERYPRLATRAQLADLFEGASRPRLLVAGDISCDVDGSLACTVRDTTPGDPVYVFDPASGKAPSGFDGPGLAVLAVGNLPCELPKESSAAFSEALMPFLPALAGADYTIPFEKADLPEELKRSVILWRGAFTPEFRYMEEYLRVG